MSKYLVFVGGGHAHLTALSRCDHYINRGHRVTVINPSPYHYYSGMGPGMLSGIYRPQDIRFNIKKMVEGRGASFIEDAVIGIDAEKRVLTLKSGAAAGYDVVSFNTGSGVPLDDNLTTQPDNVFSVKPIINLLKAREYLTGLTNKRPVDIVIVGGGPAGVEITGNVWRLVHDRGGPSQITLLPGQRLLEGLPQRTQRIVRASFESRKIRILEGTRAERMENGTVVGSDGRKIPFDVCLIATGVQPSSLFKDSGLSTGKSGGLLVNKHLQSVDYPELFGGGDCIDFEGRALAKVGVYAVRQNEILFHNLLAALENGKMHEFIPQEQYMLIFNLGNGRGLLNRGDLTWNGRSAFFLKDYIDRKFMKTFQVSGERDEVLV